jgi:hypothetical protein
MEINICTNTKLTQAQGERKRGRQREGRKQSRREGSDV